MQYKTKKTLVRNSSKNFSYVQVYKKLYKRCIAEKHLIILT